MQSALPLLCLLIASAASAQTPALQNRAAPAQIPAAVPAPISLPLNNPPPATILEGFGLRTNATIVRGYSDVAGLRDDDGTVLRVLAVEFNDLKANEKVVGLAIEVHPNRSDAVTVTSLVDGDEIDGLITGVETLAKLEHAATALPNYDARFRTRGSLELANIDDNGTRRLTLTATQVLPANGQLVWSTMSLPLTRAKELQNQLVLAKEVLARIKPATAPAQD